MLVCISYCSAKVANLFLFDEELMLSFDKKMQSCVSVLQFVVYMTFYLIFESYIVKNTFKL